MSAPDMEVIKEIPGYKVILKAVLKSQIQQLVEQLARSTDEESVILTASVADGTLCHLGSDSGKVFLEDHEDIKSQFLGFCLKRHHKQQQEKELKETQEREEALARRMVPTTPPRYGCMGPRPNFMSQRSPRYSAPHPVTLSRAPGSNIRSPGVRHSPYPMNRGPRPRLSLDQQKWSGASGTGQGPGPNKLSDGQVIKIEPEDDNDESNDKVQPSGSSLPTSPLGKPTTPSQGPGTSDNDDAKSESSSSTVLNDPLESKVSDTLPASNLSLDSDLSNLISAADNDPSNSESGNHQDSLSAPQTSGQLDPNVSVKLEAAGDSEMDLEITGVELGQRPPTQDPMGSQNWMQNMPPGASGSSADMSGYMYTLPVCSNEENRNKHICRYCGKKIRSRADLIIHERSHTGEKPFICDVCQKGFTNKSNLKAHRIVHMNLV